MPLSFEYPFLYPFLAGFVAVSSFKNAMGIFKKGTSFDKRLINGVTCATLFVIFSLTVIVNSAMVDGYVTEQQQKAVDQYKKQQDAIAIR